MSKTAKQVAKFWRVSLRTAQKWLRAGIPVDDDAEMVRWVAGMPSASQAKLTKAFRTRIDEIRVVKERTAADGAFISDPDYIDFTRTLAQSPAADSDNLSDLKRNRAFAIFKLQRSQERGDLAGVRDATESLRYISGVIHDEELRAQKLNREIGDTIPRADAERIAEAMGFWLMRGADDFLARVCKKIAAASVAPLYPEEVRALIEPELISTRLVAPFSRAAEISAACALPSWWITATQNGAQNFSNNSDQIRPDKRTEPER